MSDTSDGVVKCVDSTSTGLLPGDAADRDEWCYSGKRDSDGYCKGKLANDNCTTDYQCDVGLYCNQTALKCLSAGSEGDSCLYSQTCKSYLTCYNSVCTAYGSLAIGTIVGGSGTAKLCSTRYMNSATRACEHGPTLASAMYQNTSTYMCNYTYGTKTLQDYPRCGYVANGSLLCPPMEGDLESYWAAMVNFTKLKPDCHVKHQYGFCAHAKKLGCYQYTLAVHALYQMDASTYIMVQNVPSCVMNWASTDYWYPKCESSSSTTVKIGLAAMSLMVLLLIL